MPQSGILSPVMKAQIHAILPFAQVAISVLLIVAILLQESTAGIGGALVGADSMQTFHTKRGFEKFLFIATIVLGVLFATFGVLAIVL